MAYGKSYTKSVKKTPARKYGKKSYKKSNRAPKVSVSVQKYVKRILHKEIENKMPTPVSAQNTTLVPIQSTTWGTLIDLSSMWQIANGTGQGNRIGDKITPTKWSFRGYITNTSLLAIPCVIKMYIFRLKTTYETPNASTNPTDFYQYGSSSIAPANSFQDMLRPVNRDKYIIYSSRSFKVGTASGAGTSTYGTNNDYKSLVAFNIPLIKHQKQKLSYNDAVNVPTNCGMYACFAIAPADGSAGLVVGAGAPDISYDVVGEYEDA